MEIQTLLMNLGFGDLKCSQFSKEEDLCEGPPTIAFVNVVSWLSLQLKELIKLESYVTHIADVEDTLGFLVEVSSLLKELCCPYKSLTEGEITDRLTRSEDKKLLITYLCTELQAAKILAVKYPDVKPKMQIELEESKTAKELKEMLVSLRFPRPPDTITPKQLFGEVEKKLKNLSNPLTPKEKFGQLLFTGCLTEKQWFQLDHLYRDMYQDYKARRNLLLTRLDVTVKSFLWADRLKPKVDSIMVIYNKKKICLSKEPAVELSHVLAATADLAVVEKTSGASVRKNTKSSVNKVIIGAVPDRGGRPDEQQPPPPEVPSWQKNDSSSKGGFKISNQPSSGNTGYRENTGYKSSSYSRDENSNSRTPVDNYNYSRGGDMQRNNRGRNDYNAAPPMYQPVSYGAQLPNPEYGFGGYMPAGDNFNQYGMGDGMNQMYQPQQHRGGNRGHRGRGGYSDRGSNQSRGRGPRGGRGHY